MYTQAKVLLAQQVRAIRAGGSQPSPGLAQSGNTGGAGTAKGLIPQQQQQQQQLLLQGAHGHAVVVRGGGLTPPPPYHTLPANGLAGGNQGRGPTPPPVASGPPAAAPTATGGPKQAKRAAEGAAGGGGGEREAKKAKVGGKAKDAGEKVEKGGGKGREAKEKSEKDIDYILGVDSFLDMEQETDDLMRGERGWEVKNPSCSAAMGASDAEVSHSLLAASSHLDAHFPSTVLAHNSLQASPCINPPPRTYPHRHPGPPPGGTGGGPSLAVPQRVEAGQRDRAAGSSGGDQGVCVCACVCTRVCVCGLVVSCMSVTVLAVDAARHTRLGTHTDRLNPSCLRPKRIPIP
jgi:hypothetical protein